MEEISCPGCVRYSPPQSQLRSLLLTKGDIVERALTLCRGNEGAHLRLLVKWLTHAQRGRAPGKALYKLRVDRALYENAGACAAILTAVAEDGVDRGVYTAPYVRVSEDDVRGFAAELE